MKETEFDRLLHSRSNSENRTRLKKIEHTLRQRLAAIFNGSQVSEKEQRLETNRDNQTERINRLLVLWLDLQNAVRQSACPRKVPWECDDQNVSRVWNLITDPKNERGLEEWLFQVSSGQSEIWAQQALLECRNRCRAAMQAPGSV